MAINEKLLLYSSHSTEEHLRDLLLQFLRNYSLLKKHTLSPKQVFLPLNIPLNRIKSKPFQQPLFQLRRKAVIFKSVLAVINPAGLVETDGAEGVEAS